MHYAMGLLPQHPHIISCAIQAEAEIEFGGSACYNVMIVIREQYAFPLWYFTFFHAKSEAYFLEHLSDF